MAKLDSSGALQWHTFVGGDNSDSGYDIAVDGDRSVYVVGYSMADWGEPVHPYSGGYDILVAKLSGTGVLRWHTFLGSGIGDEGLAVSLDADWNITVAGESHATWGEPVNPYGDECCCDAAVARMETRIYSVYLPLASH